MTRKQLKLHWIQMYKKGHVTMSQLLKHVPEVDTNPELRERLINEPSEHTENSQQH